MRSPYGHIDLIDVGNGGISNVRRISAQGTNSVIDTGSVPEDMWSGGGLYPWMTAATSLEVVSTSASDTAAGPGARAVLLNLLDSSYLEVPRIVALNGLTAVPISGQYFRINPSAVVDPTGVTSLSGNYTNVGDIIIRDAGGGTIRAIIPAGFGQTQQAVYTVPAGWQFQVISILTNYNRVQNVARSASFNYYARSHTGLYRLSNEISITNQNAFELELVPGPLLPEKTDFSIRCTFVADNGSNLSATFMGVMTKNSIGLSA